MITEHTNSPLADAVCWTPAEAPSHEMALGKPFSIYVRVSDTTARWSGVFLELLGLNGAPICRLFGTLLAAQPALVVEWWTDYTEEPLRLSAPLALLDHGAGGHDLIVRYTGPNLHLFVDGVLVDEEWPAGVLRDARGCWRADAPLWPEESGAVACWTRALRDEEIVTLCGGADAVTERTLAILGPRKSPGQYWRPYGVNTSVGDCMPFFYAGRFHLFYLIDRHHHSAKWGKGAHQWAHCSTEDLVHWEEHPLTIPISEEWEGSICTGSVFFWKGVFYAFYAVRTIDGSPAPVLAATSTDGIHFTKTPTRVTLADPYAGGGVRDPVPFHDEASGLFHLLVTTRLEHPALALRGGCLARLVSKDLQQWQASEPFIVPGEPGDPVWVGEPECPDYFSWHGWYYLLFSHHGVAHYRKARSPLGPWQHPKCDAFDGRQATVLKSAPFTGDRRIGAAFVGQGGYAGQVVFREIIQHADGTLGTKFPAEMTLPLAAPLPRTVTALAGEVTPHDSGCVVRAEMGFSAAVLDDLPANYRLTLRVTPEVGTHACGICVRGSGAYADGHELRIEPYREKIGWRGVLTPAYVEEEQAALYLVESLDRPFTLEVLLYDDLLDVCIDSRRTLVVRMESVKPGDRLFFFAQDGSASFSDICVEPLL